MRRNDVAAEGEGWRGMSAIPKPIKRRTVKAKRDKAKAANIGLVREAVFERDGEMCRIPHCMTHKAKLHAPFFGVLELAHIDARGMGGNPDLTRDTTANTICCCAGHHQRFGKESLHSGYIKVRALTDKGADGPLCFEFYERLPTELGT
jgi:hypothetical protein